MKDKFSISLLIIFFAISVVLLGSGLGSCALQIKKHQESKALPGSSMTVIDHSKKTDNPCK